MSQNRGLARETICEYGDHYCYSPGKYNWKPSLVEHCGEVAVLLDETHFNAGSRSRVRSLDYAVVIEGHNIRSRAPRSRYQKLVR